MSFVKSFRTFPCCLLFLLSAPSLVLAATYPVDLSQAEFWDHGNSQTAIASSLSMERSHYQLNVATQPFGFLETVFVRKVVHNQNQHVNGVKLDLRHLKLTFRDVASIRLKFTTNSEFNVRPQLSTLAGRLDNQQDISEIADRLFSPEHHLALTFFGPNHDDIDNVTTYAKVPVKFNPQKPDNNLEIPFNSNMLYNSRQYRKESIQDADLNHQVDGVLITAETVGQSTLENLVADRDVFDRLFAAVELYIESHIKIEHLKITTKS